jgi:hypothetical protein
MARSNIAAVDDEGKENPAPYGFKADGTPRKRPSREGEKRNQKPIRMVFTVRGPDGTEIPGATINVLYAGKDVEEYTDACDANPAASRAKVTLSQTKSEE